MPDVVDDPSIGNSAVLWRRVSAEHWIVDGNTGLDRPTSQAFCDITKDGVTGMSLRVLNDMNAAGDPAEDMLAGFATCGIVSITAGQLREKGQRLIRASDQAEQPGHVIAIGKKTGSAQKYWYGVCVWVRPPPGTPKVR